MDDNNKKKLPPLALIDTSVIEALFENSNSSDKSKASMRDILKSSEEGFVCLATPYPLLSRAIDKYKPPKEYEELLRRQIEEIRVPTRNPIAG